MKKQSFLQSVTVLTVTVSLYFKVACVINIILFFYGLILLLFDNNT